MENPIVKILRFLIFFPICFIAMGIVNLGLELLLVWFMGLSKFWFIVVVIFLGGTIWGLFKLLASLLVMLAAFISPIKWLSMATISILALINGGYLGYVVWTLKDDYSGWEIFGAIIATLLVIELTFALIQGSTASSDKYY
jgi:hypothetical protein